MADRRALWTPSHSKSVGMRLAGSQGQTRTYALVPNQEQDDIENSSSDDRDDFWAELVDLMARKGKGQGKNNINQVNYHEIGVQTDFDANQIFCKIDNALLHLATVTTEAQAPPPCKLYHQPPRWTSRGLSTLTGTVKVSGCVSSTCPSQQRLLQSFDNGPLSLRPLQARADLFDHR